MAGMTNDMKKTIKVRCPNDGAVIKLPDKTIVFEVARLE